MEATNTHFGVPLRKMELRLQSAPFYRAVAQCEILHSRKLVEVTLTTNLLPFKIKHRAPLAPFLTASRVFFEVLHPFQLVGRTPFPHLFPWKVIVRAQLAAFLPTPLRLLCRDHPQLFMLTTSAHFHFWVPVQEKELTWYPTPFYQTLRPPAVLHFRGLVIYAKFRNLFTWQTKARLLRTTAGKFAPSRSNIHHPTFSMLHAENLGYLPRIIEERG
mmetsp:Transcript_14002/g.18373  ORF Transcript_14002/g.18373 Transcript_14002/m.18373 type:complete len:216 (+) Transcript_14002:437-1084(+)